MEYHRLCESEYRFMTGIWNYEPLRSHQLVELRRALIDRYSKRSDDARQNTPKQIQKEAVV